MKGHQHVVTPFSRNLLAVYQKELWQYFRSPIAYFVVAGFLLGAGYFFTYNIFASRQATMAETFQNTGILLLIVLPVLSMRLFCTEYSSGTMELLQTLPITSLQLVLGKFKEIGEGPVYFTLDGTDPRLPGGQINVASASIYERPIELNEPVEIRARALVEGVWSALTESTFVVRQSGDINEDGQINVEDLNRLCADLSRGEANIDLNGDGQFNRGVPLNHLPPNDISQSSPSIPYSAKVIKGRFMIGMFLSRESV